MTPSSEIYDAVIVGAGAAGLAVAAKLCEAKARVCVLEARTRPGGRGLTLHSEIGLALDLGCGWLHSAEQNPWVRRAQDLGFTIDRTPPPWMRPAIDVNFPAALQDAYHRAFAGFEDRLKQAAREGPDRPASSLFVKGDERWRPLLNAFSGYYNGAPFDEISVQDYAAYQPTQQNWRVREGYGALMLGFARSFAHPLPNPGQPGRSPGGQLEAFNGAWRGAGAHGGDLRALHRAGPGGSSF